MVEGDLRILTKVQRLASIGITGALRSTPTAGLKIMLHLLSLDLHLKSVAAKSAIHLREPGFWKQMDFGHGAVLRDFPGIPEATDYVTPRLDFGANYFVMVPDRSAWNGRLGLREGAISVFTDGWKLVQAPGYTVKGPT